MMPTEAVLILAETPPRFGDPLHIEAVRTLGAWHEYLRLYLDPELDEHLLWALDDSLALDAGEIEQAIAGESPEEG